MQNKAQYDLDRKAGKISTLSPNNLQKYEYLTGEALGLKPSTVEQTIFEYSPLGNIFHKGLEEDEDKKDGLSKRLKNIEDYAKKRKKKKKKKQLDKDLKSLRVINYSSQLSPNAKELYENINKEKK